MKTMFVIKPHSFVDVITNSSSELFVIHSKKDVNMIRGILEELIAVSNKAGNDGKTTFDEAFNENIVKIKTDEEAIREVWNNVYFFDYNWNNIDDSIHNKIYEMKEVENIKKWEDKNEKAFEIFKNMCEKGEFDYKKHIKVGDIIVYSRSDNSIPWGIVDAIEGMFDCQRIHLG